jgi:hypothetical protein
MLGEQGVLASGPSLARVYSTDRKVSADDVLVSTTVLPGLPAGPSGGYEVFADNALEGLEGRYYVILVLDADNAVAESNERNNVFVNRYEFPCGAATSPFSVLCIPR